MLLSKELEQYGVVMDAKQFIALLWKTKNKNFRDLTIDGVIREAGQDFTDLVSKAVGKTLPPGMVLRRLENMRKAPERYSEKKHRTTKAK